MAACRFMCTVIASNSADWDCFCNSDGSKVVTLGREEGVSSVKWRYDHGGSRIVKDDRTVGFEDLRLRVVVLFVVFVLD